MNKIIPVISVILLSGCSTEQIKTSEQLTFNSDLTIKVRPVNLVKPYRQQSRLRFINTATTQHPSYPEYQEYQEYPEYTEKQEPLTAPISNYLKQGNASWYGPQFHGKKTATGEIFDMYAMTAAHKTLPLSSYAKVTNLKNHRSVIVRINDRGPFHGNRVMDLSYAAAKELDITKAGTGKVEIKAISSAQAFPQIHQIAERQERDLYLQVGSFGTHNKALELQDKISANDLPQPIILHTKHKKSNLYKVQIGPIKSTDHADVINQKLARLGITETQLVTDVK